MLDLISRFCHTDKENINKPFNQGEHTYATNGWIAVRVPKALNEGDTDGVPNMANLTWGHKDILAWHDPPEIGNGDGEKCAQCHGHGVVKLCPECEGFCEVDIENSYNSYTVECKSCDGEGTVGGTTDGEICDRCDGVGKNLFYSIPWGAGKINALNVFMLKKLPGLQISKEGDGLVPWHFRFDGGEGLVMPMRS